MLQNEDFTGLYISRPMIPDCMHDDDFEFYFYNRNGEFNINVRNGHDDPIILFVGQEFEVTSSDNNDTFQITITELEDNHPYKQLNGRLYIKVPPPRAFKIFLNEYGWRYFEKVE